MVNLNEDFCPKVSICGGERELLQQTQPTCLHVQAVHLTVIDIMVISIIMMMMVMGMMTMLMMMMGMMGMMAMVIGDDCDLV